LLFPIVCDVVIIGILVLIKIMQDPAKNTFRKIDANPASD